MEGITEYPAFLAPSTAADSAASATFTDGVHAAQVMSYSSSVGVTASSPRAMLISSTMVK